MSIPNEIYFLVFQYLDKRTLWQCLTVSKDWNAAAIRRYYQKITISSSNLTTLTAHLEDEQSFRNCKWVEDLLILITTSGRIYYEQEEENSPNEFAKEHFLKFTTYLPNLKKIKVSSFDNMTRYLEYLLDLDSNKYLTQIEEICATHRYADDASDIYCDVYYKFRNSLKHASIYHEPESFINSKYGGILNYLNQLRNLTHLTYCNNTDEDTTLYQMQVSCPYLEMITFYNTKNVPEHKFGTIGFYNSNSLKKLSLSFLYISATYVDLITEQLPSSVNDLTITVNELDIYDWIDTVGIGKVLRLIKRMCQVNSTHFNFTPDKEYEVEHESDEESFITTFYKLLHAYKRSQKMIYIGSFNDFRSVHHHIDIENGELDFTYGMKYEDFYGNNEAEMPALDLAIPDKSASIIGLEIMNVLIFNICERIEGSAYKFLTYSLINCPNLQFVEYKAMNEPRHEFILCINPPDDHNYQHCTKKLDPSTTSQANLKVVKMKNFIPATDFLDLLSSNLPNINFMLCEYEFIRMSNDNQSPEHVVVDISNFKSLEVFYLNLQLLLFKRKSSVCLVKFNYLDGDNCCYQLTKGKSTEIKPVSLEYIQNNLASSSVDSITFKCEKIKKFVLLYAEKYHRDAVEINYGGTPYIRAVDFSTEITLNF
ncbi:hypothetical protein BD770DRAFT_441215 [Pilaira anomala]|nr:hypothetical protein BD770DRAFT_441215 [Pilaira anomala]